MSWIEEETIARLQKANIDFSPYLIPAAEEAEEEPEEDEEE